MNNKNLKPPFNKLTPSEHREIASLGGTKSGEVRRAKKAYKETILDALEGDAPKEMIKLLTDVVVENPEKMTLQEALLALLTLKLCESKASVGDIVKVLEHFRDSSGQKPKDNIEIEERGLTIVVHSEKEKRMIEDIQLP
ncbi:hypothetical protein tpqmel_0325 [Candidatus Gastranaerophilus sp. (ex Termes propinquus)]|nr:hypothetical protein tpqmel_0325 [Candidatus Gastranaerophilus sp. (ex Termes propinquus)]